MNASGIAQNGATGVLVACALLITIVVVKREFEAAVPAPTKVEGWRNLIDGRPPSLGTPNAKSTVILFSDYDCPYCKDLEGKLTSLVAKSHGSLAVVRYEFPIVAAHPRAYESAVAAKCATREGVQGRFQAMLFETDADDNGDWKIVAEQVGLADADRFLRCVETRATAKLVDEDMAVAGVIGVDSVPSLIVDGKLYTGTRDIESLEEILAPVL